VIESLLLIAGIHPNPGPRTRTRKSFLRSALRGRSGLRPLAYTDPQIRALARVLINFSEVASQVRARFSLLFNFMLRTGFFEFLARRENALEWHYPVVNVDRGVVAAAPEFDPEPQDPGGEDHLDLLYDQNWLVHALSGGTLNANGHAVVPGGLSPKFLYLRHKLDDFALRIGEGGPGGACFGPGSPMSLWRDNVPDDTVGAGIKLPVSPAQWNLVLPYAARQVIGELKNVLHWKR